MIKKDLLTYTYNPDVLSCLANLSNDEVFTPPSVANKMLDMLPGELFCSSKTMFLDPACKSGIFLREIAKRLLVGLENEIPDLQARLDHIFRKQLYGIAITEMTSLLSRRSVYCSKHPNGKYSITSFKSGDANIRFKKIQHHWVGEKCLYCGASQLEYDRDVLLESHAYEFIHTTKPEDIFEMKFDVIIGNPPYQLSTGGSGVQATPIYNKFIEQAKKMSPRYISMIIPARWFSGGFGLDKFRNNMLTDNCLRIIHDYPEATDVFQGVQIKGGICYFLWVRDNPGDCAVTTHRGKTVGKTVLRPLLEHGTDVFIRYNEAISILHKVCKLNEPTMVDLVSTQRPFGLPTNFKGKSKNSKSILVYGNKGLEYCDENDITKNHSFINRWKVLIPRAGSGSDSFPHPILGKPFVAGLNTACTETYVVVGPFDTKKMCDNATTYIATRFFRFLVMLMKPTQDALRKVYSFVPIQDFNVPWSDEMLYKKYGIVKDEIEFIESMVRPVDLGVEDYE